MLANKHRFHGHGSLRYVYRNGKATRNRLCTIKHTANPHRKQPRIAVVVSKKVLKSAVGRNRIRRRVYEAVRTVSLDKLNVCDIVIIVTSSELRSLSSNELRELFDREFTGAGLYKSGQ